MYKKIINNVKDRETISSEECINFFLTISDQSVKDITNKKVKKVIKNESIEYIRGYLTAHFKIIIEEKDELYIFNFFLVGGKPTVFDYDVTDKITKRVTVNNALVVCD